MSICLSLLDCCLQPADQMNPGTLMEKSRPWPCSASTLFIKHACPPSSWGFLNAMTSNHKYWFPNTKGFWSIWEPRPPIQPHPHPHNQLSDSQRPLASYSPGEGTGSSGIWHEKQEVLGLNCQGKKKRSTSTRLLFFLCPSLVLSRNHFPFVRSIQCLQMSRSLRVCTHMRACVCVW